MHIKSEFEIGSRYRDISVKNKMLPNTRRKLKPTSVILMYFIYLKPTVRCVVYYVI